MADGVTYIGHSTVLVDLDGSRILTDPVLRNRVLHLRRTAPISDDVLPAVDAVLISHAHWDHLDVPSLERVGQQVRVVVARGLGRLLRKRGFADVVEVDVGEHVQVGRLDVAATHAEHDGSRGRLGVSAPAIGFTIAGSKQVYFAGDTDLFAGMEELAPLDVALLPVSGWGKVLGPGHLDPRLAAEALRLLRPRVAIPIHWGTLAPFHHAPPTRHAAEEFRRQAGELAPDVDVRILALGERLPLA